MTEAIYYIKTDKEATKAIIGKYTRFSDPEGLERTYKNYTAVLLDVPYADPAGIKTLLDDMSAKNPKAASADAKSFVDSSFVHGSFGFHQAAVEEVRDEATDIFGY
jgi:hypothetical protein